MAQALRYHERPILPMPGTDDLLEHLLRDLSGLHQGALQLTAALRSAASAAPLLAPQMLTWAARVERAHLHAFAPICAELAAAGHAWPPSGFAPVTDLSALTGLRTPEQVQSAVRRAARQLETAGTAAAGFAASLGLGELARSLLDWCRTWIGLEHRLDLPAAQVRALAA